MKVGKLAVVATALTLSTAACAGSGGGMTVGTEGTDSTTVELRNHTGPHVDDPDRAMAMTVDAVEIVGDDVLVRIRVVNSDDEFLDIGVEDTIYGPLLVMRDDLDNSYESYAVEPAGIPGRRVADLSFRMTGPLDSAAETFVVELATQRGLLTSPAGTLPDGDGVRWRVDSRATATSGENDPAASFAAAPRLPDLVHFWLETEPLPAGS